MKSKREFELSEMSYSKYNLHHILPFSPFLSTVNLQTLYNFFPMTVKYTKLFYIRSYILPRFFFSFLHGQVRENPSTPLERTP